ncbi:MAG: hypothetical protein HGB11_08815 [Chlorobiales bacterium]|nr:hypothetical protein [Chlorobiales bacterium]
MNDPFQTTLSVLALLGVGGIVGGYLTYLLDKKKEREFKVLEQKEKRYKSCLLYMDASFNPENIKYLSSRQPDIDDSKDILEYLEMEYHEMVLYASKEVILSIKVFIENPTHESFLKTILTMRQDLAAKRVDLDMDDIRIDPKKER